MSEKRDWQFDFVVENLTREQADGLLDAIIELVEGLGTVMGGGLSAVPEDEGDDEFDWSERKHREEGDEPDTET